jgi:hypothetical protein
MGPFFLARSGSYFSTKQALVRGSTGHSSGLCHIPEVAEQKPTDKVLTAKVNQFTHTQPASITRSSEVTVSIPAPIPTNR